MKYYSASQSNQCIIEFIKELLKAVLAIAKSSNELLIWGKKLCGISEYLYFFISKQTKMIEIPYNTKY